ncbi:ABC transporter permease [Erysipelothrix sp. HDW6A]|uniref:ABC transporter permease n=1 Tax=Erysipelothrix sp. HDW6A TaxID=2714928 RepID=UPI00140AC0C9|nr:ABC transporter permease [Erysipelothrix sp. HDW6A]QIK56377.1 ABC transporter permease [Erysipelothrix sp. HDW6A]
MPKKKRLGSILPLALMLLFFYGPIIVMMVFSFNDSRSLTSWSGFSTRWYETLFNDREMLSAVRTSVLIAVLSTAISTVVGTLSAIGISKHRPLVKKIFLTTNNLPVLNPEIVTAIGFMLLFSSVQVVNRGFGTMLLAHITFCTPYVILTVLPKLRSLDPSLADAAMDLGATPRKALTKVILPQLLPAIISAALIAFTMSFDDFVISYFVTGNGVSNISILVYSMSKRINPSINALSTIIVAVITVALIFVNVGPLFIKKKNKRKVVVE